MIGKRKSVRRGINIVEVGIVVAILAIVVLFLLMRLPRSREATRWVSCQRNLMQIGVALSQYHADAGHLPIASLGGEGPLRSCLQLLALPDFRELTEPKNRVARRAGFVLKESPVPGFICPTDTNATSGRFPAPVSYRASTGSNGSGTGGAFALGQVVKLSEVEAKRGVSYTAAFSERLVGDLGPTSQHSLSAIRTVTGELHAPPCPSGLTGEWQTDAGSSWWKASWASTLYSHALVPNDPQSCVSAKGTTGLVGASSAHPEGVNVLLLDGSVKSYSTRVAPKIWQSLGTIDDSAPSKPLLPNPGTP